MLTALAVALGVAVVIAIELAGDAAAGSFRASVETLAGDSDFEVTATAGGVPPEILTELASLPYSLHLRPRIEDYAVMEERTIPLIAVDLLADALPGVSGGESSANAYQRDDSIWAGDGLGLHTGDRVRLLKIGRAHV